MTTPAESWLALDVGGANIKAVHSVGFVRSRVDELSYELLGRADQAMYQQKEERKVDR